MPRPKKKNSGFRTMSLALVGQQETMTKAQYDEWIEKHNHPHSWQPFSKGSASLQEGNLKALKE